MAQIGDPWHYPRTEDAENILKTLEVGLVSAVAIIEPRRKGKTTFILNDLMPASRKSGFLPIYINLASTTGDLEALIAGAIVQAVAAEEGFGGKLLRAARSPVKKVTAKAKIAEAELGGEVELQGAVKPSSVLVTAFRELSALGVPVLFLFDEVHRLAEATQHGVAWSLRSLLDANRQQFKAVATSSSAASYEALTTGERQAFNRWFTRIELAPLGDKFTAHLVQVVSKHYPRHSITLREVREAFAALGDSPKFVRDYLNIRILNPTQPHETTLRVQLEEAEKETGYADEFNRLPPLARAILVALAQEIQALFSEVARSGFAKALKEAAISKTSLQRTLRSLADKGLIIRSDRGEYRIADSLFEQWLSAQIKLGVLPGPLEKDR